MTNIILCGGNGTRLWPVSRTLMPKQYVKLFDNKSLFQLTVKRNSSISDQQFIVSNTEQYFLAVDQLEELNKEIKQYLLEPIGKNTAPAIALACFALPKDEVVLVTPSDHLIKDKKQYQKVVHHAKELALDDFLVTFGITPTFPETGFGYIEADNEDVRAFHEKPDFNTAKKYLAAGNFYWNSGMFCFKAGTFLKELEIHAPDIYNKCQIAYQHSKKKDIIRISYEDMFKIPEESIDYAVIEKSSKVKVVPSDIDWSDLGSFDALYNELPKDQNGNTINDNLISIDSKNNLVYGSTRKITTIDINDLIIIDTDDALLISKKGSSQKVKEVVKKVCKNTELHNIHLTAHRPWGIYTILDENQGYKVKQIIVKPNKRLSLQKHTHRSEHWIVISGIAKVTRGNEEYTIQANESTYIPINTVHRLENIGDIPLVMIEAQVGDYVGEDDIIRIEDDYKRIEDNVK